MILKTHPQTSINLRSRILSLDKRVPLLNGRRATYINLYNAASTGKYVPAGYDDALADYFLLEK